MDTIQYKINVAIFDTIQYPSLAITSEE